jgi:hypothetical protein
VTIYLAFSEWWATYLVVTWTPSQFYSRSIFFDVAVILAMQCSAFASFGNPKWLRIGSIMEVLD